MRWLWDHNRGVQDELRSIVEPLTDHACEYIDYGVANYDVVAHETDWKHVQKNIPFGDAYTVLPPRLFGPLNGNEAPVMPRTEEEAEALVRSYVARKDDSPYEEPFFSQASWAVPNDDYFGTVEQTLKNMIRIGVTIDPVKWERYKEVGREQAASGRYDLDIISARRTKSIVNMLSCDVYKDLVNTHGTGCFTDFMMMPTAALDIGGKNNGLVPVGYLFMPVGEYGPDFSEKLLRTTTYMVNTIGHTVGPVARTLAEEHPEVITKHTARGADPGPLDRGLTMMTQEGARSIMEATAFLTAQKVDGYDTGEALFEAIVEQGILEHFTRSIPMGVLGPFAFLGRYFPDILQNVGHGKLRLNPEVMDAIKDAKRENAKNELGGWAAYWAASEEARKELTPPHATSLICPAAMPHGALSRMSRSMLGAFNAFHFASV